MAFSEQTAHYGLPHWLGDDKPTFLGDMNDAFEDIDGAIYEAKQEGETGQEMATTVDGKVTALTDRVETLETDDTALTGRVGTLETTVSGQGGSINTINSLIGNGEPTTTDKTLIGAINELNADLNGTGGASEKITTLEASVGNLVTKVGTATLTTTAPDLCGAVNELNGLVPKNGFWSTKTLLANSSESYTIPNSYKGFILCISANSTLCGMYLINATSGGAVSCVPVLVATDLTVTGSTNSLAISNGNTASAAVVNFCSIVPDNVVI